jgi:hypothetical protein
MSIGIAPECPAKLRRSGMNRASGGVRADSNTCRSYGAWLTLRRVWL